MRFSAKRRLRLVNGLFGAAVLSVAAQASAGGPYFPPPESEGGWRSLVKLNSTAPTAQEKAAIRERAGFDWDELIKAWDFSSSFGTRNSVVIIRRGWIAGEWRSYEQALGVASCTKSITALTMARIFDESDRGRLKKKIEINDPAWKFIPIAWSEAEPARKEIQIRHMLTMTSGLTPYDGPYKDIDYAATIFAQKVVAPPGTVWAYASAPVDLLSYVTEDVTGAKLGDYFNDAIGARIGSARIQFPEFNSHSGASGGPGGGARFVARELARLGYLLLRGGAWERDGRSEQVISRARVEQFTSWASWLNPLPGEHPRDPKIEPRPPAIYGHLFWTNHTGQSLGPAVPRDAFYMSGWGKQCCVVIPSLDLVVVRLGADDRLNQQPEFYREFFARIMKSIVDAPRTSG
jgi:CubicO group peptidase (beta-lactamase class C family)